ncbi:MAG: hypothetical protein R3346_00905 [Candidatus Spechtbacterales bacterium]|nr:hypothetical protein [Candidatus Spechtbacterales bacterium]
MKKEPLTELEELVMRTLSYFNALGVRSLTLLEFKKYLLNNRSKERLFDIQKTLSMLKKRGLVNQKNGFWYYTEEKNTYPERIKRAKTTLTKWDKFSSEALFLTYIPYIRSLAVTGSVSLSNSRSKSDIDIMIRVKEGRIWISRLIVTLVSYILKRRRYGKKIQNRLCFNHYIATNENRFGPPIIHRVVSNIHIPVWDQYKENSIESLFFIKPNKYFLSIKKYLEIFLEKSKLGNILENIFGKIQIKKIQKNPIGYPKDLPEPVIDSGNLIFYYPKVKKTQNKYIDSLKKHGLRFRTN